MNTSASSPSSPYPVAMRGRLDEPLNQWLWLVKWLLAIPHILVLAVLWLAVVVVTVVAWVTIVFTGRYPQGIFDFTVGVMRWSWRVQFYAFVLGTDRYPPFSLQPDADYPAELHVEYPETLSRGLVWVKAWLLAIPHYLIIAFFAGGPYVGLGGLAGVLALVAGVTLAVTQRYPQPVFDFIMGMRRWIWRVAAYALLMRDEYPPFQLDMGPDEPAPSGPPTAQM